MPKTVKQSTTIICRTAYVLEHDNNAKIPVWVSYVLTPGHATGCIKRSDSFSPDLSLPSSERSELKDYAKSGYDMGHLANNGDMSWDVIVEREGFILSNMTPQMPGFNRGIWKRLEDQTRAWAVSRNHTLLIYTGPVYSKLDDTIGPDFVVVPRAFYKVIIDTVTNEALVFEFPHRSSQQPLSVYMTNIAKIQKETGIQFPMPSAVKYTPTIWQSTDKNVNKTKKSMCSIGGN